MGSEEHKDANKEEFSLPEGSIKYLWIVGIIILLVAGFFAMKAILGSFEGYRVSLVDAAKQVDLGNNAAFTWRVDGPPTTINYTAVHLGLESNPGDLGTDIKPQDTKYTEFVTDFVNGKYDIPLQFVGNIRLSKIGKYYFRVHALVKEKNYWSEEYNLEVKLADNSITVVDVPKSATAGNIATFTWRIDGPPATTSSTAVYFGAASTSGELGKEVKPQDTEYTDAVKDFIKGKYSIPYLFVGNVKIASPGAYFYRAHVDLNGQHYWSPEGQFEVK